jgi:large subunit ribosomal protein L1
MGKIRARTLGYEDIEEKEKQEQKERAKERKAKKFQHSAEAQEKKTAEEFSKKAEVELPEELKSTERKDDQGKARKASQKVLNKALKQIKNKSKGKKYKESLKMINKGKVYSIEEAIAVLKKAKYANFDESVELHLNVEKKGLKGEVEFPHSTGKVTRVKIVDDQVLDEIENGRIEFDVLVSHPSYMSKLAKYAKILGPKGLMPNPKSGTISPNPEEAAKKFEKGTVQWKTEPKFPIIHKIMSKSSLEDEKIVENINTFLQSVGKSNIVSAFVSTSMSPSVQVSIESV